MNQSMPASLGPDFTKQMEHEMEDMQLSPLAPLQKLRTPFPVNQISKLPKPTKQQTEEVKADYKKGIRCTACGAWHHPNVVHLDYVGHAALTDRLLDTDIVWSWEPLSMSPEGLPVMDGFGGMWIKLTVCGITRLGYGHAGDKEGGDAIKEVIGDALRNAAMRFGAALDLWHKGDLHAHESLSPVKEALKDAELTEERKNEIENMALIAIDQFKRGDEKGPLEIAAEIVSNDDKLYFWHLLRAESKLRSFIKANLK